MIEAAFTLDTDVILDLFMDYLPMLILIFVFGGVAKALKN